MKETTRKMNDSKACQVRVQQQSYKSVDSLVGSDHKPVFSRFCCKFRMVDAEREKTIFTELSDEMSIRKKNENGHRTTLFVDNEDESLINQHSITCNSLPFSLNAEN